MRVGGKPTSIGAKAPTERFTVVARLGRSAIMNLAVDGKDAAKGQAAGLISVQPKDELTIGEDARSAVGKYSTPNPLTDQAENVRVVAN